MSKTTTDMGRIYGNMKKKRHGRNSKKKKRFEKNNFIKLQDLPSVSSAYHLNIKKEDIPYDQVRNESEHSMRRWVKLIEKFQPHIRISKIEIKTKEYSYYLQHHSDRDVIFQDGNGMAVEALPEFVKQCKRDGILSDDQNHLIVTLQEAPLPFSFNHLLPKFDPCSYSIDPKNREKFKKKASEIALWLEEINKAVKCNQSFDFSKSVTFGEVLTLNQSWDILTLVCEKMPGAITHVKEFPDHLLLVCQAGLQLKLSKGQPGGKQRQRGSSGTVLKISSGIGCDLDDGPLDGEDESSRRALRQQTRGRRALPSVEGSTPMLSEAFKKWRQNNFQGNLFKSDYRGDQMRDAVKERKSLLLCYERARTKENSNPLSKLPVEIIRMVGEHVVTEQNLKSWLIEVRKLKSAPSL